MEHIAEVKWNPNADIIESITIFANPNPIETLKKKKKKKKKNQ